MVVSKERLIKQMQKELQLALKETDQIKADQRIASVRSLCELVLSSESTKQEGKTKESISPEELKAMLGRDSKEDKVSYNPEQGDSIFDF